MDLYKVIVIIHVISGMSAFVAAPIAMIVKKGGNAHRKWGKFYFWCMTFVVISGIIMSVVLENLFLFCVAFFAYYLVVSGYRWLYRKKPGNIQKVATIDWVIVIIASVFNIGLLILGALKIINDSSDAFGYISSVFGLIGINFAYQNVKQFYTPPKEKQAWLYNHIGGMIGAYIATVSAFSAVNFSFLPDIVRWLWPTVIGTPIISLWIAYYRKKFNKGKRVEELADVRIWVV